MTADVRDAAVSTPSALHRERLLAAMVDGIRERGLQATTVADIVARAKTSRRTFYEHFDSKEDCYLAVVRAANERLAMRVLEAIASTGDWRARVSQAVHGLLEAANAEPEIILSWIRELSTLGDRGLALERETGEAFIALMLAVTDSDDFRANGVAPPSREVALILLGGLRLLVASTLEEGRDAMSVADVAIASALALLQAGTTPPA